MKLRIVVLGAGFGGLELTSLLSEALPDQLDLTLIDRSDSFTFGFSKLDVMFGRRTPESVKIPYSRVVKPGVKFVRETALSIDPLTRHVQTDRSSYDADVLVIALGAEYDIDATPGLAKGGNEFYTLEGAERLRQSLPGFMRGHAVVGVASAPFKCPPAPSEAALLLHDHLTAKGTRDQCHITLVMPFATPIPPSPATSEALLSAFAERKIDFLPNRQVKALDPHRKVVILGDGSELPYDLFLGIPKHRVPDVVAQSGMTENGWIPVSPENLRTKFHGVYAIGDVTSVGTPKAGVFAEGAARVVAESLIAEVRGGNPPDRYKGAGSCYVEFGGERVGRVDVDFFSGPKPVGTFTEASTELAKEKEHFGSSRRSRWFRS